MKVTREGGEAELVVWRWRRRVKVWITKGFTKVALFSKSLRRHRWTRQYVAVEDATNLHLPANATVMLPPLARLDLTLLAQLHFAFASPSLTMSSHTHTTAAPRPAACPTLSSHTISTPPSSPAQIMMMRTLKLAVATHLLLWGLCHGIAKGVSGVHM